MMDNFSMIRDMEKECSSLKMEINMMESGKMMKLMGNVIFSLEMEANLKGNTKIIKNKEKEFMRSIHLNMKEILWMICLKGGVR